MGASENKQLSLKMYQSQAAGDHQGFLNCCAEDITITVPGSQDLLPWRVHVKGRNNIPEFFAFMGKYITIDKVEMKELVADGDKVVIFLHEYLTVVENKFSFELDEVHVHTHKDGKIVDISMFEDTATVVAAVRGKKIQDL